MIRRMGKKIFFTYSQTLNWFIYKRNIYLIKNIFFFSSNNKILSGLVLVSKTGDVG